jgi:hypothetical protein
MPDNLTNPLGILIKYAFPNTIINATPKIRELYNHLRLFMLHSERTESHSPTVVLFNDTVFRSSLMQLNSLTFTVSLSNLEVENDCWCSARKGSHSSFS